ncbi:hypothetical protein GGI04_003686 [Coemansia thaxteri]|nr:hypothetical protein GGI04_003686 [Coemansia thaxteri]KAJ2480002.1 hypothetical protein EV174_003854 [Coemansia sp. RSA 2320]
MSSKSGDAELDSTAMAAELQKKLEKYDQLEKEIAKLAQEQATLESYVANLIRSTKTVNYYEARPEESGDSDFDEPSTRAKAASKKRGRPAKSKSQTPPSSVKKTKQSAEDSEDSELSDIESSPENGEGQPRDEGSVGTAPVLSSSPAPAAAAAKRGSKAARDDSDSDSDAFNEESDTESDYEGEDFVIDVVVKGKAKAATEKKPAGKKEPAAPKKAAAPAKKAAASAKKAAVPAKKTTTPVKKVLPAVNRSGSQLGSLLQSPSSPTSPRVARPVLTSSGSSGSLSLQLSPVAKRKIGVRNGGSGGVSSLKSLLGGSTAPRAGLSRRMAAKK